MDEQKVEGTSSSYHAGHNGTVSRQVPSLAPDSIPKQFLGETCATKKSQCGLDEATKWRSERGSIQNQIVRHGESKQHETEEDSAASNKRADASKNCDQVCISIDGSTAEFNSQSDLPPRDKQHHKSWLQRCLVETTSWLSMASYRQMNESVTVELTPSLVPEQVDGDRNRYGHLLRDVLRDVSIFFVRFRKRVVLLVLLLVFQSFSSFILSAYEDLITHHPVIIAFLTMLVGAGGNAGNQAAVLVIRGLATGEITARFAAVAHYIAKEMKMAFAIAIVLSACGFARVILFDYPLDSAVAIATALFAIVFISVILGAILPLGMHICRADPAHAGATIQVVMDLVGVLITCLVCSVMLGEGPNQPHLPHIPHSGLATPKLRG
mmetsp:Transcript_13998/g.23187  ORF Transcript_13998/g.23187 Transcript_13998/m.23187 type:complete len:381 (+) Transcript_13998:127-1269(+)|eukprot:CAMPEP_0119316822 /NCGR_PEP_ID=MMETSP1333-20130426/41028_1 /TAXON_ID=418940 /ORGANISM="Scyphosphaera apsteinii, Strain RCC1455" /LENGTH=380 /DNA_ID=CAMNT_0007322579 /DNA_START=124 /DNA_END=1266 /DNA_ORIENTATION=+